MEQTLKNGEAVRGYLIDPEKQTITEISVPYVLRSDGEKSLLRGMYDAIGCRVVDCVRDAIPGAEDNDIWVDEEGIDDVFGFSLPELLGYGVRLGGRGLVLGVDIETGDETSSTLSSERLQWLKDNIIWLNAC